jgi:hypothetical protein
MQVTGDMERWAIVEEIRRAFAECGFTPPDVGDPSEAVAMSVEEAIEEKTAEVEGHALVILGDAAAILLWAERGNWDAVSSFASRIASAVARIQEAADYAKRASKLKERLHSILEKGLNNPDA